MKNLFKIMLVLAFALSANALEAGKDYIVLKTPIANAQGTVIEVFSYRCSHCYDHYKFSTMAKIKAAIPDAVYKMYPVKSMGKYGKQAAQLFAYAAAHDKDPLAKSSLTHKLETAYFNSYFKKRMRWGDGADPAAFYETGLKAIGITKAQLDEFLASPKGKEIDASYDVSDPISKNFGTPGFVVNGKYQVNPAVLTSPAALINIVKELLKM